MATTAAQVPPGLPDVLALAHRGERESQEFQSFLALLAERLRRAWIQPPPGSTRASNLTLAEYLGERASSAESAGDEQSVVDQLSQMLLEALGYNHSDWSYNRALAGQSERAVPDYSVRIQEILGTRPLFIIEDKATSVRDFHATRRRRSEHEETPLEQLRRYVLSGAVHGRVGLLCNGFVLEAWEFGVDGEVLLVRVDLRALALLASSPRAEPFPGPHEPGLRALWERFSRSSFTASQATAERAFSVPPFPPRWLERIQQALSGPAPTQALEKEIRAYHEELWRLQALGVERHADTLVESLRGLIEQITADVRHQLDEALAQHGLLQRQLAEEEKRAEFRRQQVSLLSGNFNLSEEQFKRLCLDRLDAWLKQQSLSEPRLLVETLLADLQPHLKVSKATTSTQMALMPGNPAPDDPKEEGRPNGRNGHQKHREVLENLRAHLMKFCEESIEGFLTREESQTTHGASLRTSQAWQGWKRRVSSSVLVGAEEETLRSEFARQTSYVYLVRLLLVRICEDKNLFHRKLSNGGLVLWRERVEQYLDYATGRSYDYLTSMAYECAHNVYVHFHGSSQPFNWYRMDDKMLLRALLVLNAFNLENIDTDIIGTVYGRYLTEGKHEQGRYYTPQPLVRQMLDMAGWRDDAVVDRRLCDLACGSGSFLVEACRRLLDRFRGPDGRIPRASLSHALQEVQRSLYGLDINPFACYLAETNLLIQVLELVQRAHEENLMLTVDRFHVYCEDSLLVDESLAQSPASAMLLGQDQAVTALLKARAGGFHEGFDVLVGNPPYVRADEKAPHYLAYRRLVEQQHWFTTRHLKWDLYVPFVEQYHRLLSDSPDARCCLITIESLGNASYAEKLRELLGSQATVHDIVFTRKLKLFEDAKWQDNIIFSFSRPPPPPGHQVHRRLSSRRADDGSMLLEEYDSPIQAQADIQRLFNSRQDVVLDVSDTARWEEICYVTKGMVLHSHEKLEEGAVLTVPAGYDPARFGEELVEDLGEEGKKVRHKRFVRDELIAEQEDDLHTRRYLGSAQVLRGGIGHTQWLEHGPHTRCPSRVSRETFPELYDRPKVMFGKFTGVAVDDGALGGFLVVSDGVRVCIRWELLEGVDNRSVTEARRELEKRGLLAPKLSRGFSEWYLCALALSQPIASWLKSRGPMKQDIYPDDIRAIPVKKLSPAKQKPFIELAQERHRLWSEVMASELAGYSFDSQYTKLNKMPVRQLAERFRAEHPEVKHLSLVMAAAKGLLHVEPEFLDKDLKRAKATGDTVTVQRSVALRLGASITHRERIARLLAAYVAELPGTFADRQGQDLLPATETGLLALADFIDAEAEGIRQRLERLQQIQQRIDDLAWELYKPASSISEDT